MKFFNIVHACLAASLALASDTLRKIRTKIKILSRNQKQGCNIYPLDCYILKNPCRNKQKSRTIIIGYYGSLNFGDEFMLDALLEKIDHSKKEVVVVINSQTDWFRRKWPNIKCYYPPKRKTILKIIANDFDELILGGGAHIDDHGAKSLKFTPYLARILSLLFIKQHKKVRWISVSSNTDLKDSSYIKDLADIAVNANEFSVRDSYSLNLLSNLITNKKITLSNDLILSKNYEYNILGVVLIDTKQHDTILTILNHLVQFCAQQQKEWRICFIPWFNQNHSDFYYYTKIKNEIDFFNIKNYILPEYQDLDAIPHMLRACDLLFSMRYHASLLALHLKIPVVSFCLNHRHYPNKMKYIHDVYNNKFIMSANQLETLTEYLSTAYVNSRKSTPPHIKLMSS